MDATGGQAPGLLATYGRQPFLWRFCRRLVQDQSVISGDHLSYVLGSYWSDDSLDSDTVTVEKVNGEENLALLKIMTRTDDVTVQVLLPVTFMREVQSLIVDLPGEEVLFAGWPDADIRSMRCTGDVRINAGTLRFDLDRLQIGELSTPSSCHIVAQQAVGDQRMTIDVQSNSTLTVGGNLADRFPWDRMAETEQQAPSDDPIWDLLADCAKRLHGKLPVVVFEHGFGLTGDRRVDWARRHGDLFPRLLRALIDNGFATTSPFDSKEAPKIRVRPARHWSELKVTYEGTSGIDQSLQQVLKNL